MKNSRDEMEEGHVDNEDRTSKRNVGSRNLFGK